ncbi:MAG TPA: ABC transporter permease, partial [Solirubrobacterales bacterium]|nr:ABC transporter permease [Solirubrobacterales bacterium]
MSLRLLAGRLLLALLSLWGVSVLVFVILRVVPGDPALLMAPVGSTAQDIERLRAEFGLAGPWWRQYAAFFAGLVRGHFGRSLWLQQDALGVILGRLPATLELAIAALGISVAAGILLGVLSVWRRGSFF